MKLLHGLSYPTLARSLARALAGLRLKWKTLTLKPNSAAETPKQKVGAESCPVIFCGTRPSSEPELWEINLARESCGLPPRSHKH